MCLDSSQQEILETDRLRRRAQNLLSIEELELSFLSRLSEAFGDCTPPGWGLRVSGAVDG
jgi:hypothetical protein